MPPFFPETFTPFDIPVPLDPFQPTADSMSSPAPTPTPSRTINIHGLKSPPTGPALLLLHGFPQTHAIFRKIAPALSPHFQLILPDLRCYGDSSTLPSDDTSGHDAEDHALMRKSVMARDCVAVMCALGSVSLAHAYTPGEPAKASRFFVLGHDRGARVAHQLAVDFPHLVRAQVLLDICPTLCMYRGAGEEFARAYWHWFFLIQPRPLPENLMLGSPESLVQRQVPDEGKRGRFFGDAERVYVEQMRVGERVHGMCEDYRASAGEDLKEQERDGAEGRRIKCPTRVLWGREGAIERLFDARKEWSRVCEEGAFDEKGSTAVEGGHYIPEERPEDVATHCLEFFLGVGR